MISDWDFSQILFLGSDPDGEGWGLRECASLTHALPNSKISPLANPQRFLGWVVLNSHGSRYSKIISYFPKVCEKGGNLEVFKNIYFLATLLTLGQFARKVWIIDLANLDSFVKDKLVQLTQNSLSPYLQQIGRKRRKCNEIN